MRIGLLLSFVEQDHACGRAVGVVELQRQSHHMIPARCNLTQIEALENNNVLGQQYKMRRVMFGLEAVNGQRVDSNKPEAELYEKSCRVRFEEDEILVKAIVFPPVGVVRSKEDALDPRPVQLLEMPSIDRPDAGNVEDRYSPDKQFEGNFVQLSATIDEMIRSIDVRSRV
jgi:hypothetical protein